MRTDNVKSFTIAKLDTVGVVTVNGDVIPAAVRGTFSFNDEEYFNDTQIVTNGSTVVISIIKKQ